MDDGRIDQQVPVIIKQKLRRGFAAMSREKLMEISAKGGRACPPEKRTFAADPSVAADAGRIGGKTRRKAT